MVSSDAFRERLRLFGISESRIKYLPQWAEDVYQVQEPDAEFAEKEGMAGFFNIVFAGNIGLWQNVMVIVDAASLLRDVRDIHFVILGDGVKRNECIEYARRKGLTNVDFKGRKPVELMPKYFALAAALLAPLSGSGSYSAMVVPGKLQSYFACGRPVIGALKGVGARIVETAGAGVVCEPDDPSSLADAVLRLYNRSKDEREAMGQRAREYYDRHFRREIVLSNLEEALQFV
jgi:glycosyltransferase involved in cell wall biosynthesis